MKWTVSFIITDNEKNNVTITDKIILEKISIMLNKNYWCHEIIESKILMFFEYR